MEKKRTNVLEQILSKVNENTRFYENEHIIFYKQQQVRSATSLLNIVLKTKMEKLKAKIDMEKYAKIGTEVHENIERYLHYKTVANTAYMPHAQAVEGLIKSLKIDSFNTEIPIATSGLYGGVIDLVGYAKTANLIYIIDYKTSTTPQQSHEWQIGIYMSAIKEYFPNLLNPKIIGILYYVKRNMQLLTEAKTIKITEIPKETKLILDIHKLAIKHSGDDYGYYH